MNIFMFVSGDYIKEFKDLEPKIYKKIGVGSLHLVILINNNFLNLKISKKEINITDF